MSPFRQTSLTLFKGWELFSFFFCSLLSLALDHEPNRKGWSPTSEVRHVAFPHGKCQKCSPPSKGGRQPSSSEVRIPPPAADVGSRAGPCCPTSALPCPSGLRRYSEVRQIVSAPSLNKKRGNLTCSGQVFSQITPAQQRGLDAQKSQSSHAGCWEQGVF